MTDKVPILKIIAKNILRIRKERKMDQKQLAYLADTDATYIEYIENLKCDVTISKLQQIAEALKVSVNQLINTHANTPEQNRIGVLFKLTNSLMPCVKEYQKLADEFGINNIFYNKGGKLLQVIAIMNLKILPAYKSNMAYDEFGNKYKVRLLNIKLTKSFSTHHHMNPALI